MIFYNSTKHLILVCLILFQINEIITLTTVNPIVQTRINVKTYTTNGVFKTKTNSIIPPTNIQINKPTVIPINNVTNLGNNTLINANNTNLNTTQSVNLTIIEQIPTNWTSGHGTHYGPFPSYPHFSEIGYQPNDVGVGCSDGRPGGDPEWKKILAKGLYPSPKIPNHERTIWPLQHTVAVSAAVWNKEDVCWKTLKIRNKNKPEYEIEAVIVDFCPIGYCNWEPKYLSRNADIYGEAGWKALGAGLDDHSIELEIEWPKGVIPHDAITLSSGQNIKANLISTLFVLVIMYCVFLI